VGQNRQALARPHRQRYQEPLELDDEAEVRRRKRDRRLEIRIRKEVEKTAADHRPAQTADRHQLHRGELEFGSGSSPAPGVLLHFKQCLLRQLHPTTKFDGPHDLGPAGVQQRAKVRKHVA